MAQNSLIGHQQMVNSSLHLLLLHSPKTMQFTSHYSVIYHYPECRFSVFPVLSQCITTNMQEYFAGNQISFSSDIMVHQHLSPLIPLPVAGLLLCYCHCTFFIGERVFHPRYSIYWSTPTINTKTHFTSCGS